MTSDTNSGAQLPATATAAVARGSRVDAMNPVLQEQFGQQQAALKRRVIRWVVIIDLLIFAAILWWFFGR